MHAPCYFKQTHIRLCRSGQPAALWVKGGVWNYQICSECAKVLGVRAGDQLPDVVDALEILSRRYRRAKKRRHLHGKLIRERGLVA